MKKAASVLGRVFLGFILFLTLVPFYLLLSNSFKWSEEIVKKPFTLPAEWHFTNYAKSVVQVIHPMANTLLVTSCVIVIVLIGHYSLLLTFCRIFHSVLSWFYDSSWFTSSRNVSSEIIGIPSSFAFLFFEDVLVTSLLIK